MKILKLVWLPIVAAALAVIVFGSTSVSNTQLNQKKLENKISQLEIKINNLEEQLQNQGKVLGTSSFVAPNQSEPKCPEIKFTTNRYLKNRGEDISALQCLLDIEKTEIFDGKTKDALVDFQIKNKIVPDKTAWGAGYFGPRTRKFLNEGVLIPYQKPKIAENTQPTQSTQIVQPSPQQPSSSPSVPQVNTTPSEPQPQPPPAEIPKKKATVEIAQIGSYQVELQDEDSAFSILLRAGQENNFSVKYTEYTGMGVFVDCLGGICSQNFGTGGTYWAFYYNGTYSQVGASLQPVVENDLASWKFETW
ncbi:MAG: hypothetical protein COU44_02125 [Candidatus Nealsonbacteria bacterium CG10_big_fil_rev_8_21_14_0_10_40_24]|nr:MAG: hypothetical protein COU44_02125 [Candidatus Nealsonbacteria bacterium CG10_big_fil_rev_8_21_14_0_10_40_24]